MTPAAIATYRYELIKPPCLWFRSAPCRAPPTAVGLSASSSIFDCLRSFSCRSRSTAACCSAIDSPSDIVAALEFGECGNCGRPSQPLPKANSPRMRTCILAAKRFLTKGDCDMCSASLSIGLRSASSLAMPSILISSASSSAFIRRMSGGPSI